MIDVTPDSSRGHEAGARYLAEFIEDVKESGFVARAIEKHKIRGLTVAPAAPALIDRAGSARVFSGQTQAYRSAPGARFVALDACTLEVDFVLEHSVARMADAAGKRLWAAVA
jgi:hypothetical protein